MATVGGSELPPWPQHRPSRLEGTDQVSAAFQVLHLVCSMGLGGDYVVPSLGKERVIASIGRWR